MGLWDELNTFWLQDTVLSICIIKISRASENNEATQTHWGLLDFHHLLIIYIYCICILLLEISPIL